MSIDRCRVCNHKFSSKPLLVYKNMPRGAQFLPDRISLKYDKGITLKVYQCPGCGLVQLNNEPVPYYKEVIRSTNVSADMKNFRLQQFGKFVAKYSLKKKKIIEIGCGRGDYLSIMHKFVKNSFGLEFSLKFVNECKQKGLNVSKGFVQHPKYKLKNNPFDAFFILNFLEHLPNPNLTLMGIANNLKEGGIGLVEVPNFDMILQKKLFSEFIPDHLFYFTKETLITTLNINGFEVIECNEIWHNYIISAIVKKRKPTDLFSFQNQEIKLKNEIKKYLHSVKNKKIAIWGAGHQSLAFIALMRIENKIEYVIDSAPFKQGKYTPVTHIPIVGPDMIKESPVDVIIVIAASYSDEVVKIIRRKFNKNIEITIIRDFGLERG